MGDSVRKLEDGMQSNEFCGESVNRIMREYLMVIGDIEGRPIDVFASFIVMAAKMAKGTGMSGESFVRCCEQLYDGVIPREDVDG